MTWTPPRRSPRRRTPGPRGRPAAGRPRRDDAAEAGADGAAHVLLHRDLEPCLATRGGVPTADARDADRRLAPESSHAQPGVSALQRAAPARRASAPGRRRRPGRPSASYSGTSSVTRPWWPSCRRRWRRRTRPRRAAATRVDLRRAVAAPNRSVTRRPAASASSASGAHAGHAQAAGDEQQVAAARVDLEGRPSGPSISTARPAACAASHRCPRR